MPSVDAAHTPSILPAPSTSELACVAVCWCACRTFEQSVPSRTYTVKLPRQRQQLQHTQQQLKQQLNADDSKASDLQASAAELQANSVDAGAAAAQLQQGTSELDDDPFAEQPVLPVTWLSYKGSSSFLVWVAGQGAGQVSSRRWHGLQSAFLQNVLPSRCAAQNV